MVEVIRLGISVGGTDSGVDGDSGGGADWVQLGGCEFHWICDGDCGLSYEV